MVLGKMFVILEKILTSLIEEEKTASPARIETWYNIILVTP